MKKLLLISFILTALVSCAGMNSEVPVGPMMGAEETGADAKLTAMTAYEAQPAAADLMYFVDVAPTAYSRSITISYLFSYLTDKDVTVNTLTTAAAADPYYKWDDSSSAGDDYWTGGDDSSDWWAVRQTESPDGSPLWYVDQNGVHYSDGAGTADPVIGDPDSWSPATADYYGGTFIASANGTSFALPALVSKMNFSLSADNTITVTIDRNGSDTFTLNYVVDGTPTQATGVTSIDMTGPSMCVFQYRSSGVWQVYCDDGVVDGS
jgi:hypothetical protein